MRETPLQWIHSAPSTFRISFLQGFFERAGKVNIMHRSVQVAVIPYYLTDIILELSEPKVVSEAYPSRRFPDGLNHWDIDFIFKVEISQREISKPLVWCELKFIDLSHTKKSEITRWHDEILESVGLMFGETNN